MKKRFSLVATLLFFCSLPPVFGNDANLHKAVVDDVSRLNPVQVSGVIQVHEIGYIQKALKLFSLRAFVYLRKIRIFLQDLY